MNSILALVRLVRLPNLLMIALVQWVIHLVINIDYQYPFLYVVMVNISTILIAAAGYILNDVNDVSVDASNNKVSKFEIIDRWWATLFSAIFIFLGLFIGLFVCYYARFEWFTIYVVCSALLVLYAYFLSRYKFIGNLLIALLIVASMFLMFLLERAKTPGLHVDYLFVFYAFFAFVLTWIREIVKDCEDVVGDKSNGRITLATHFGWINTKYIIYVLLLFFLIPFVAMICCFNAIALGCLGLVVSLGLGFMLFRTKDVKGFHLLSQLIKFVMLIGILSPLLLLLKS